MKKLSTLVKAAAVIVGVIAITAGQANAQSDDNNDRRVIIENLSTQEIMHLYWSNVDDGVWHEDRLGDDVIESGDTVTADIDDDNGYCMYDLKAVLYDGTVFTRYDVNVCAVAGWDIFNRHNRLITL